MGPARRWCQSGNLTGPGVQLSTVGTRPWRGGSSPVPLGDGGRGDRTWREPGAGRREGAARSAQGHVWLARTRTSLGRRGSRRPRKKCPGGRVRPARESRSDESAGQGKLRPPTGRSSLTWRLRDLWTGSSPFVAGSSTGSAGGLEREGSPSRWGRLGKK